MSAKLARNPLRSFQSQVKSTYQLARVKLEEIPDLGPTSKRLSSENFVSLFCPTPERLAKAHGIPESI